MTWACHLLISAEAVSRGLECNSDGVGTSYRSIILEGQNQIVVIKLISHVLTVLNNSVLLEFKDCMLKCMCV